MQLENYFSESNGLIEFSRKQASNFAKQVAGDFNPIHDEDARRFVVPGDLLFAVSLRQFGLSPQMEFNFGAMVAEDTGLDFSDQAGDQLEIAIPGGKSCLTINRAGEICRNPESIKAFANAYVAFSGYTFPHVLVPLMQEQQVMINPERPMVMYQSMAFELDSTDFGNVILEPADSLLEVNGKRGNVTLVFNILADGKQLGQGRKRMVLSGLREYDQAAIDDLVDAYQSRKSSWAA